MTMECVTCHAASQGRCAKMTQSAVVNTRVVVVHADMMTDWLSQNKVSKKEERRTHTPPLGGACMTFPHRVVHAASPNGKQRATWLMPSSPRRQSGCG